MTFMDRYGEWLWLALFASGGIGSGIAWITQLFVRKRRELVDKVLDWTAWLSARSGEKGKPPLVGSEKHFPLQDAPGTYVLEK
jgi:hypothetical protein